MPKDEFDFDDPMELNGVGIVSGEDTTEAMTECFIEEFMRLGYNHRQLLALFRNPHYIGMNMALQNRGEPFVREKITEIFARWGRPVRWQESSKDALPPSAEEIPPPAHADGKPSEDKSTNSCAPTDPMGAPPPDLSI